MTELRVAAIAVLLVAACGSGERAAQVASPIAAEATDVTPAASDPAIESSSEVAAEGSDVDVAVDLGPSGLAADLESLAEVEMPMFIEVSPIPAEDLVRISKFRSAAGHDYSDSSSACCSMKHYLIPREYDAVRFSQLVVSPVDGVVVYAYEGRGENQSLVSFEQRTGIAPPEDYRDLSVFIRPDAAPNVWIRFFHLSPSSEILGAVTMVDDIANMTGAMQPERPGHRVSAGDPIGVGLGEMSIEQHMNGPGMPVSCSSSQMRTMFAASDVCGADTRFHSLFALMSDEAFDEFASRFGLSRGDIIISEEERTASPLKCEGEEFVERDVDSYLSLGPTEDPTADHEGDPPEDAQALDGVGLPSVEEIADGRAVQAAASGTGSGSVTLNVEASGVVYIAANGGPLELVLAESGGARTIHQRPDGAGTGVAEVGPAEPGEVRFEVVSAAGVEWSIVVVD